MRRYFSLVIWLICGEPYNAKDLDHKKDMQFREEATRRMLQIRLINDPLERIKAHGEFRKWLMKKGREISNG